MVLTRMVLPPHPDLRVILKHVIGENLVQEALWHLSQADIASSSLDIEIPTDSNEVSDDYQAIASSLRILLQIFWDNAVIEGFGIFFDSASFTRLSLADVAEAVGEKSSEAAQKLHKVEDEVQAGERDHIGIKKETKEFWKKANTLEAFDKSMDIIKDAGSAAIGSAQSANDITVELTDRSRTRLRAAVLTVNL
jgi:hypothetical protein